MGDLKNKKTAFSITTIILGVGAVVAFIANIGQIKEAWFPNKSESSSSKVKSSVVEVKPKEEINVSPEVDIPDDYSSVVEEIPQPAEPSVVYLDELKVTEGYIGDDSSREDTLGNKYTGHLNLLGGSTLNHESYGIYYLGGKYKTLSGTIAIDDITDKDRSRQLYISADNNIIYTTDELTRTTVPFDFTVNVENCQWLKISNAGDEYVWFILHNWRLE
ncbi:MAG: NPCBM/NEW2 domain-containing protein [Ruminococcus sp.]|nr:NPCBM/NEW2 domain-containing protein [Ruminococcus sp.]